MLVSVAAVAGPDHKHHKKGDWMKELGLTEAQVEQVKEIKQSKHDKMMAYKEQLSAETDEQLAEVLTDDQMDQLQAMREEKKNHMAAKKHKKHKKHKKYKKDRAN